jgi:hypothetical protein
MHNNLLKLSAADTAQQKRGRSMELVEENRKLHCTYGMEAGDWRED